MVVYESHFNIGIKAYPALGAHEKNQSHDLFMANLMNGS